MRGHIRKRGKRSWAIKLDIGRDPETNKRRTKWHTVHGTKRDAEKELARLLHQLDQNTYVEPSRSTIKQHLSDWIDRIEPNVRPKTAERYNDIIRLHLIPMLGHHRLDKLAPIHIEQAWQTALTDGRRRGKGGLAPRSVQQMHRLLSQALKAAVRLQLLARNPADAVAPPRAQHTEMQILTPAQSKQLLGAVHHTRLFVPILLALTTGMRRGEILGLRWRDVDLAAGWLSVNQSLEQTRDGLRFQPPKTARSRRRIPLPAMTVEALVMHRKTQAEELLRRGRGKDADRLVVCKRNGEPMQPRTFTIDFMRAIRQVDVPRIRFHDLRHSHLSHLLAGNIHPKVASERAGHSRVNTTLDTYSHVLPDMQSEAAQLVDDLLGTAQEH